MQQFTLSQPQSITSDGTNLYVINLDGFLPSEILKVDSGGVLSSLAGSPTVGFTDGQGAAAQFSGIISMVYVASNSLLYVVDSVSLRTVTLGGLVSTLSLTGIPFDGNQVSLAWDGNDTLYTGNLSTGDIYQISLSTHVVSLLINMPSTSPNQICYGGGFLYVIDSSFPNSLYQINVSTTTVTSTSIPNGILSMTYLNGNVYFTDTLNNIEILTGSGAILAGNSDVNGGYVDANGTSAALNGCFYITSMGSNLYISDPGNNAIRQLIPSSPYPVSTSYLTQLPPPTNITVSLLTATSITLSWTRPTTGLSISGYNVFNNCNSSFTPTITTTGGTAITFSNLTPGASYTISISATTLTLIGSSSLAIIVSTNSGGSTMDEITKALELNAVSPCINACNECIGCATGSCLQFSTLTARVGVFQTIHEGSAYMCQSNFPLTYDCYQTPVVYSTISARQGIFSTIIMTSNILDYATVPLHADSCDFVNLYDTFVCRDPYFNTTIITDCVNNYSTVCLTYRQDIGPTGPRGIRGPEGPVGPTGPCCTGPTGPTGPNVVPLGQGYSDTATFQYNYVDTSGLFHAGIQLPTGSDPVTIGTIVARPSAPLRYANIVYSTATATDIYNLVFSNSPTNVMTFPFSSLEGGLSFSFSEIPIPPSGPFTNPLLYTLGVSTATGLYINSLTLGYN